MAAKIHDFSGVLTITAPSGGLTEGTMVDFHDIIILPLETAAANASCEVLVVNGLSSKWIEDAPKVVVSGTAVAAGDVLYWDKTNNGYSVTASGNTAAAIAKAAATATATTVDIIPIQTAAAIN